MEATLGWRNTKCLRTTVRISLSVFPLPSMGVTWIFIAGGSPNHQPNYTVMPPNCYILGIFLGQLRTFTTLHGGQGGPPTTHSTGPAGDASTARLHFALLRSASLRAFSLSFASRLFAVAEGGIPNSCPSRPGFFEEGPRFRLEQACPRPKHHPSALARVRLTCEGRIFLDHNALLDTNFKRRRKN